MGPAYTYAWPLCRVPQIGSLVFFSDNAYTILLVNIDFVLKYIFMNFEDARKASGLHKNVNLIFEKP